MHIQVENVFTNQVNVDKLIHLMKTENTLIQRDHEGIFFILKKHLGANHDQNVYNRHKGNLHYPLNQALRRWHLHQFCPKHNTIQNYLKRRQKLVKLKTVLVLFSAQINGHTSDVDYKKP